MARKAIRRALAALVTIGSLAAAGPALAVGAPDTPPEDGSWISASPSVVNCTLQSEVKTVRLSWWTPPRSIYPGFEDRADSQYLNGVYVDGVSFDTGRLLAGEEHSVTVPFRCDRDSHTYIVTNPSGYGNIKVVVTRNLRSLGDLVKDKSKAGTTLVRPGSKVATTPKGIKPCRVRPCVPEVDQPIPAKDPGPGPGPGSLGDSGIGSLGDSALDPAHTTKGPPGSLVLPGHDVVDRIR